MEQNPKAPPVLPKLPLLAVAPGTPSNSSKSPDSPRFYGGSNCDCRSQEGLEPNDTLDVQYFDVLAKLEQLVKKARMLWNDNTQDQHIPWKENEIHAILETFLIDLRVWAKDISEDDDSLRESLEWITSRNVALNASLQQILRDIRGLLTSADEKLDEVKAGSRFVKTAYLITAYLLTSLV
jgi:hypothetical protein